MTRVKYAGEFAAYSFRPKGVPHFDPAHPDYGADPTGALDSTTAINNAIIDANAAGGGVVRPVGMFKALSIALLSNVTLDLTHALVTKNGGAVGTLAIGLTGATTGTSATLTADVARGAVSVSAAAFPGFAAGDWALLRDATYKYSTSGRNQEILRVLSVSGGTLTFVSRTLGAYATASTAEVVKLSVIENAHVIGGTVTIGSGTNGGGIMGTLCVDCTVEGTTVIGANDMPSIYWQQSLNCRTTKGCRARDSQNQSTSGSGYGFAIGESSVGCVVEKSHAVNVRENPMTNNARLCAFVDNLIEACYDDAINTHGSGVEQCEIRRNRIVGSRQGGILVGFAGSQASDTDILVVDNEIIGCGGHAIAVQGQSSGANRAKRITVRGNKIRHWGSASTSSWGAVFAQYADDVRIGPNDIDGDLNTNTYVGVWLNNVTKARVGANVVSNMTQYCYRFENSCDDLVWEENETLDSPSAWSIYHVYASTPSTNVWIKGNKFDTGITHANLQGTERRDNNKWATTWDRNRGATSVADGGTITHGCAGTPSVVRVTPSIGSQMASVTAVGSTTFTVALKTDAGAAGTTQTVYWEAEA